MPELLAQDALVEAVAGVVQHDEVDAAVHRDVDALDAAELGVVGDRARRAQQRLDDVDLDLGVVGQERALPAPRAERRDRGQRQQRRVERQDRPADREVVGGRSDRGGDQDAVGGELVEPDLAVDADRSFVA